MIPCGALEHKQGAVEVLGQCWARLETVAKRERYLALKKEKGNQSLSLSQKAGGK